jgi:DNA helicase-2/ATP-dependent DNA helicase PcrA
MVIYTGDKMILEGFEEKFNIELSEQQWEAVKAVDGATLLLAVPGSGKTKVLVTRLGYMIYCCGIKPEEILTVTCTVDAAMDMKQRFIDSFGGEMAERLEFCTINGIFEKIISHCEKDYCIETRNCSMPDCDDQFGYAYTMLKDNDGLLAYFQSIYKYICVDDAQDISKIQHMIISLLAGSEENIFMAGDENQSIYSYRAAYPEALFTFEKDHEGAKVLLLEQNFRSNAKIVKAADKFIQKNQLRHRISMTAVREDGTDIRDIEIKNRRAQYTYLAKVAANCSEETAILYRNNDSVLPLIDLLERQGTDYRIRNADLSFFSDRVVNDITNIIKFAYNPMDIEIFMQIYFKISTFMSRSVAIEACRMSKENHIPIIEAALTYGELAPSILKNSKAIQTHLKELVNDPADRAVYRIVNFMGYGAYLERMNIRDSKVQILDAIGLNETTPMRLIERLDELAAIIREKKQNPKCYLILSTIHASKGLEYNTVYIMDAKDGIFPENVVKDRDKATRDELKEYEEERRLYYVGITRAKNQLNIFSFKNKSAFTDELLEKSNKPMIRSHARKNLLLSKSAQSQIIAQKVVLESEYLNKLEEIKSSGHVKHKTYGDGKILALNGDTLEIAFANKTAKCKLKFLMENGLIL